MADSKLILEIGARLGADFATAFSSAQAKINALGQELSELKRKQALLKKFEIDTQNVETAKQRLEAARQKVDDLRKAAANDPTGSLNKQLAAAEREAEKLNTTLGKTEERLQRTKERMESAGLSAENTGQQLETLAKQAEKVEKAIASKGAAMERNNRLLGQLKVSVLDVADSYKTLAAGLLATKSAVAVLSAAVAGAVPVLGQMAATGGMIAATFMSTLHIAGVTKEMQGLADTTGMTTQSLRELQLLSGFEGVDRSIAEFGDATKSLEAINQRIMQIGWSGTKNDNFAAYLDKIGINVDELRGKKPDEVLLLIDDALKKTGATARETENFFEAIAGKGTSALIPLLQKQNAELALARQYISDVGAIQSESEIAAMTQTNKELSLFKIGLEGVATRLSVVGSNVVNTLGPNIRQLFIDAKKPIAEWGEAVDKTLKKFKADLDSGGWGMAFSNMFKAAYPTLHQFVSSAAAFGRGYGQTFIGPMLEELKKGYAGISNALAGAGGAEALGRGMGEAMQPVISIVHNVVGAVKLLIANWDTLKTVASFTPVGFVVSHWDAVVSVFSAVGNGIRRVGEALGLLNPATTASASGVQIFLAALGGLLAASASTKLALGLVGAAVSTFAFALGPLASALGIVATAFKTLALAAIANPIGAAIAVIAAGAVLIYANWDKISGWWSGLWGGVKSTVSNAWTSIKSSVVDTGASIAQSVSKTWADVSTSVSGAWGSIKQGASTAWAAIVPSVSAGLNAFRQAHVVAFEGVKNLIAPLWTGIVNATRAGLSAIAGVASAGWSIVKQGAELAGTGIKTVVSGWWAAVKTIFSGAWTALKTIVSTGWAGIKTLIQAGTQAIQGDFSGAWKTIKTGVSNFIADVLAALRKSVGDFASIGKDMLAGLARGIADVAAAAVSKAKAVAGDVYSSVKGFFQIHSPSRLMAGLGLEVSTGLAVGIESAGGKAVQAATSVSVSVSEQFKSLGDDINKSLTDSFMSLDFSNLGQSLTGLFKQHVVQPILSDALKPLSDGLAKAFGGLSKTLSSSIGSMFGGLGNLFGGGLGSLIGGGLIAGIGTLIKGLFKKEGNLVFSQGMQAGQQLTGQGGHAGKEHWRQTDLGLIGATNQSNKIGREQGFVPEFHKMLDSMTALDSMIAQTIPNSVGKIKEALAGMEQKGFSTADMLKQRYQTVFSALPEELQKAMANGRDMTKLTAEEIIAEFGKLSEVAKSGLVTSLQSLGLNLGSTKDSALAAALGLTNLMGGIDQVKAANDFFYQEFFSEEERKQAALKQANTAVLEWNKSLGLSGVSAIKSHEAFKKYVLGLDLSTEAGRKAYAEAMKVAGSLDAVADAAKAAKDAAKAEREAKIAHIAEVKRSLPELGAYGLNLGDTRLGAIQAADGLAALMGGMDQLKSAAQIYYNEFFSDKEKEQLTLANAAAKVALLNQQLGLTGDAALDTNAEVRKYLESLDPTKAVDQEKYAAIMKVIGALDKVGDSGKSLDKIMSELPPEMLKQALMQAKLADEADKSNKKTGDSLDSATKKMADLGTEAGKLAKPIGLASDNAVTATTNIGAMKTAVGGLATALLKAAGDISAAATKAATTTTTTTTKTDGSHALGLRTVPFDGYRAVLHKNEAVIPARDAAILRMGLPVQMDAQTNILSLNAANDEQPVSLPTGVIPLPQRVSQALSRAAGQTQVDVNLPHSAPINITIHAAPGQSVEQLAALVKRELEQVQRAQARQLRAQHRDGVV